MAGSNPRDRRITQGWLDALRKRKEFRKLPDKIQRELAHMIWMDIMKVRAHSAIEGATSYTYEDLNRRFGRGQFAQINAATEAFVVGPWSKDEGRTKSYQLSTMYKVIKRQYLKSEARKRAEGVGAAGVFIDMAGRKIESMPRPIASKREDGSSVRLWGGVEFTSAVPVSITNLEALYKHTWADIKRIKEKQLSGSLFSGNDALDLDKLELRAEWAATLLVLANTALGGCGWLPMRYREAQSGRLYAMDDNLQNCPKAVRMAALDGMYDYDISNCHYTLLEQLAANHGIECPAIRHYLENKSVIREGIAMQLQVSIEKVKTCLLALIYGAELKSSKYNAIGKVLGKTKANELLAMDAFKDLANEVRRVGGLVLELWPVRSGSLINIAGCGIKQSATKKEKLAHLLQGAEALILKTAVQYLEEQRPRNVILLQHDGFTAVEKIDAAALHEHIKAVTGFAVEWEEQRIQPSPDKDFSKMVKL